jgi:hypothetical protein
MRRQMWGVAGFGLIVMASGAAPASSEPPQGAGQVRPATVQERREIEVEARRTPRVPVETRVVRGAPYFAEVVIESVQPLPDGNRIVNRTTGRVYRDSEGRVRREEDRAPGQVGSITISDPVAGTSYSLDPASKTAWKSGVVVFKQVSPVLAPRGADPAAVDLKRRLEAEVAAAHGTQTARSLPPPPPPPPPAPVPLPPHGLLSAGRHDQTWEEKTEKLPARNIEGVMAEGTRITRTIRAGAIGNEQPIVSVTEEWVSSELQILVLTRTSDPRTGEYTYRLLNVARSEPNRSWFEVPGDYSVQDTGMIRRLEPTTTSR